jgi:hypothetical protein
MGGARRRVNPARGVSEPSFEDDQNNIDMPGTGFIVNRNGRTPVFHV